ncbi:MAG: SCP-2 sterol transfer family protein [Gammaproteobacteria bacterium]|nr:SCP-2 sterol transfer family protein [Gammaproteobacteria bacterium]
MTKLFNEQWMQRFQSEWNKDTQYKTTPELSIHQLRIGYGFPEESTPRCCFEVNNGQITHAGAYQGQELDWDLRAREPHWKDWQNRETGSSSIGMAYSSGKLKILTGDYWQFVKNPAIKHSLLKCFSIMGRL